MFQFRKTVLILLGLIVITLCGATVFGSDYFLYDAETAKILVMSPGENAFTPKIEMDKIPVAMSSTSVDDKYIAIFPQEKDKPGQLAVFNAASGRIEDLMELGYPPFNWIFTLDRSQFYILCRQQPDSDFLTLYHYDISKMKSEKIVNIARNVIDLNLSSDEKQLLLLVGRDEIAKLFTIDAASLKIDGVFPAEDNPERVFSLDPTRVLLLSFAKNDPNKAHSGYVKLIDTSRNAVMENRKIEVNFNFKKWYPDEGMMLLAYSAMENNGPKSYLLKITAGGIDTREIPNDYIDFRYFNDYDSAYILTTNGIFMIDYKNDIVKNLNTDGPNYIRKHYFYLDRIPDSNLAVISCFEEGLVKFFDLEQNKVVKTVTCGRKSVRTGSETTITTNDDQSKIFILNRSSKDITVFSDKLELSTYLVPAEAPLGMIQIEGEKLQTLITTKKMIYRINEEGNALVPVVTFSKECKKVILFQDDARIICANENELLVMDADTLQVKSHLQLYSDKNEKYQKLKPGAQRYYMLGSL